MATNRWRRRAQMTSVALAATVLATACPPEPTGPPVPFVPTIGMSPQLSGGYFNMPWPNDIRRTDQGMTDWTYLPGIKTDIFTEPLPPVPLLPDIVKRSRSTVNQFGRNTAVFFQANAELAPASLPTPAQSLVPSSSVLLVNLETGELAPTVVVNQERPDRYRPAHLLTVLPYPGHPLAADTDYAAMVFDDVTTTTGEPLEPSATIAQVAGPYDPSLPMSETQHAALAGQLSRVEAAISDHTTRQVEDLVAFTVYRTQDTGREWNAVVAAANDLPTPTIDVTSTGACAPSSQDPGGTFSLITANITLPVWRNGRFPYLFEGGKLVVLPNGKAQQFGTRVAPVELMVPCAPMPTGGWPVVTHVDGTGGDQHAQTGFPITRRNGVLFGQISPLFGDGVGDAAGLLKAVGFPTLQEQQEILFYNLLNPDSIRSNPLQQAADHLLFTRAVAQFSADGAAFGQVGAVHGNPDRVLIEGHSQGAQTLPMIAAVEPMIDGVVSSSGSGGQYHTLAHSPRRLNTFPLVTNHADRLDELNPLIQVVQTVFEASDGANFANDTHFLNYVNYADTCTTVETGLHYSRAQGLTVVPFAPLISYGEPSLDVVTGALPISGNSGGRTRVSILLPGGHFNYMHNIERSTEFQTQVLAGQTPTVPNQTFSYSSANCDGDRYDDPPRLFGI